MIYSYFLHDFESLSYFPGAAGVLVGHPFDTVKVGCFFFSTSIGLMIDNSSVRLKLNVTLRIVRPKLNNRDKVEPIVLLVAVGMSTVNPGEQAFYVPFFYAFHVAFVSKRVEIKQHLKAHCVRLNGK